MTATLFAHYDVLRGSFDK